MHAAVSGGAQRVELCSALELDGLTPPTEDLLAAKSAYPDLTVHVLIRPRAGNFCYAEEELRQMGNEIEKALEAGADGIVIGCLTREGEVDRPAMKRLMGVAQGRASVTFHRAFDLCREPFHALEQIVSLGCDRILTSGKGRTAEEGVVLLRALCERAQGRIGILPGGGITPENASRVLAVTGCEEIHASASVSINGKKVTSAEKVTALLQKIKG